MSSLDEMIPDTLASVAQDIHDSGTSSPPRPVSVRDKAPTMGNIAKVNYSHLAMIDLILANPGISQNDLAVHFGYSPGWISNVMAADAFQAALAARRAQLIDPVIVASIEERARGMMIQSHEVLTKELEKPAVKPEVALRCFELGAKVLGLGGHAAQKPVVIDLTGIREKLLALRGEVYDGTSQRVKEG